MSKVTHHLSANNKRKLRIRSKISATAARPKLTVFRSNKYLYLQVISESGQVLAASSGPALKKAGNKLSGNKTEKATLIAADLAEKLKKQKIKKLVFDRGAYRYQGRVAAVAEFLRKAGLEL